MSNPRLSIIPAGAVTDRSLEPRDLQVLCLLGRHTDRAGWCVRSQVRMAGEIACSRGSLQNSLDRLITAGWVEKKRRDLEVEEARKQPSRSYAYRVVLDRDDFNFEDVPESGDEAESESYAKSASEEGGCQPVGTPVPMQEQHGGAIPRNSTPANLCDGTKNDPLERPQLKREKVESRAREPLIGIEAHAIAVECLTILGIEPEHPPPDWFGLPYQIQILLTRGCERMTVVSTFAQLSGRNPRPSINYFVKAVETAQGRPKTPIIARGNDAAQTADNRTSWQKSRDDFRDAHAELRAFNEAYASDQDGDETGGSIIEPVAAAHRHGS